MHVGIVLTIIMYVMAHDGMDRTDNSVIRRWEARVRESKGATFL